MHDKTYRNYIILSLKINLFTSGVINPSVLTLGSYCSLRRLYFFPFLVVNLSVVDGCLQRKWPLKYYSPVYVKDL